MSSLSSFGAGDDCMAIALKPGGLAGYAGRIDYAPEFSAKVTA